MIKVASAQYPITSHKSFQDWKAHIEKWIHSAVQLKAELLLFPEYGAMELVSLFSKEIQQDLRKQLTELQTIYADFQDCFASLSQKYNVIIVAPSFPVAAGDKIHNRTCVFGPKGLAGFQDKFFMTRFEDESWGIHAASKVLTVFEAKWGSFGIQTCYDVEFTLGAKLLCEAGVEIILAPSCTETLSGATRVHIGARARALENQCYTVVSQTVGNALWSPAVNINFGFAAIYSTPDLDFPEEGIINTGDPQHETWIFAELDFNKIKNVRSNGKVLNFRDHQTLQYHLTEEIHIKKIKL